MFHRPTLTEFVEEELQLAQPLFGAIADAVLKQWRNQPPSRLSSDMDAIRVLHQHRDDFVRQAIQSMHEQTLRRPNSTGPSRAVAGR
jgi:hypothetical protein